MGFVQVERPWVLIRSFMSCSIRHLINQRKDRQSDGNRTAEILPLLSIDNKKRGRKQKERGKKQKEREGRSTE